MRLQYLIALYTLLLGACAGAGRTEADAEVRRLCAIDGGIKVNEVVKLPGENFGKNGLVNFFRPIERENALGPHYIYSSNWQWLSESGSGASGIKLSRIHVAILRRSDNKLLSEMTVYQRAGGDPPGPWFPSVFRCPEIPGLEYDLLRKTFAKTD